MDAKEKEVKLSEAYAQGVLSRMAGQKLMKKQYQGVDGFDDFCRRMNRKFVQGWTDEDLRIFRSKPK